MYIHKAKRMDAFQQSIFSELSKQKNAKVLQGNQVIDLSIGSPDLPPPPFVLHTLSDATKDPNMYGYALKGTENFHQAVRDFYARNYSVHINSNEEVISLMGSQDGLVHLPLVLCDPGDYVLVPDPGYTAYATGVAMAGAKMYQMPLKKENDFLPNFKQIPQEICEKARLLILNYPGNPVPAMATKEFFEEAIDFAKKNQITILHDFAYSELYFEQKPISFLSVEGAKDVGIEMNSLSKTFNMAGTRIAYAVGNIEVLQLLANLKSNIDYGVFLPIQAAAEKALLDTSTFLEKNRAIYKKRRDILIDGFKNLGWNVTPPPASMFIWAEVPNGYTSMDFTMELLEKANLVVTPGNAFGQWGEGYVRIALVQPEETLKRALDNIAKSGLLKQLKGEETIA